MKKTALFLSLLTFSLHANCFRFSADVLGAYRWDAAHVKNHSLRDERPLVDTARFENVGIWEVGGKGHVDVPYNFFATVEGRYGWVTCGDFQVKERFEDGIQELAFFGKDNSIGGNASEVYGVVGYNYCFCYGLFQFAPEIGYAYYQNCYRMKEGKWGPLTDFEEFPDPFFGEYNNHSRGVLLGFTAGCNPFDCVNLYTTFYYNWLSYHANGNGHVGFSTAEGMHVSGWQDFTQDANMRGPIVKAGADVNFWCNFYAGLQFTYRHFSANCGSEDLLSASKVTINGKIVDGSEEESSLELDHLKWDTKRLQFFLGICF